jgi:hypothetical protein
VGFSTGICQSALTVRGVIMHEPFLSNLLQLLSRRLLGSRFGSGAHMVNVRACAGVSHAT